MTDPLHCRSSCGVELSVELEIHIKFGLNIELDFDVNARPIYTHHTQVPNTGAHRCGARACVGKVNVARMPYFLVEQDLGTLLVFVNATDRFLNISRC
ncbi:hypothetical protein CVT25_014245 [Psilocybe cyanescens]|uniref:Uncharacterized protein n=1 Tax=Psilocybe cyanescens TaxID=93625 RepID=A0A409XJP3_PSICY|nr:hypothetical protein CVT25_014245 [Psilocybe cyanescens]